MDLDGRKPYPSVHATCRFWADILLMFSAIGKVIYSLITVMVCRVRAIYSPVH
jgi:hypothetical protein